MNDREISQAVAEFFGGNPRLWTQNAWARDRRGESLFSCEAEAVCWCMDGAAQRARVPLADWKRFCKAHFGSYGNALIWNDAPGRTFADVERKLKEIAGGAL